MVFFLNLSQYDPTVRFYIKVQYKGNKSPIHT